MCQEIKKKFNFENYKACATPIEVRLNLTKTDNENKEAVDKPVRELIGCLMYLLSSRPDISFAVNYFSRYQDKYPNTVWQHHKRLLRYLKGTVDLSLVYIRKEEENPLICYVDADWGGDIHDRKSVSGFLIKLFNNIVSWTTKKQNCIALSTTEVELVALCSLVEEGLWFKKLLLDFNIKIDNFTIFEDNQACIFLIKNPENNKRVKHIDLKFKFICDNVKNGVIQLRYINGICQQADILTKGLTNDLFSKNRKILGLDNQRGYII